WIVGSGDRSIGAVGEVDPGVVAAYGLSARIGYLTVSLDSLDTEPRQARRARDLSRYPASDLDLAFVVADDVPAWSVQLTLEEATGDVLESITLFDVYRGARMGPDRRSLAFRLRFRAPDHTLDEAELAALRERAIDAVGRGYGAELRR